MQQVHRKVPSCECERFSFWKFQRRSRSVEMAKPKNEDHKPENSDDAIVQHQKLCLAIDMDNRRIYGYTELKVVIPESGHVGLHADNMTIEAITVDGEAAEFELFPHYQFVDDESRWSSVSSATSASQAASSSLEMEMAPNLQILCKSGMMGHQQQTDAPNNCHTSTELKQKPELGGHTVGSLAWRARPKDAATIWNLRSPRILLLSLMELCFIRY